MPDPLWWAIHAVQEPALLACVALAASSGRRIGAHTPYGSFLFVVAAGLWLLLVGDLVFMGRVILGVWERPGTLADVYTLAGWLVLTSAFMLLSFWFPSRDLGPARRALAILGACAAATAALLALAFVVLSRPGEDPAWTVRAAFLVADGLALGALWSGSRRLRRLRQTSLGRLFAWLGLAIVLKVVGDLAWVAVAAKGLHAPAVSIIYPASGAIAVLALVLHHRDVRRDLSGAKTMQEPWIRAEQRLLRDFAEAVRGMAGAQASRTVLDHAADELRSQGVQPVERGGTLHAEAGDAAWARAVEAARRSAEGLLGRAAADRMADLQAAYGLQEGRS